MEREKSFRAQVYEHVVGLEGTFCAAAVAEATGMNVNQAAASLHDLCAKGVIERVARDRGGAGGWRFHYRFVEERPLRTMSRQPDRHGGRGRALKPYEQARPPLLSAPAMRALPLSEQLFALGEQLEDLMLQVAAEAARLEQAAPDLDRVSTEDLAAELRRRQRRNGGVTETPGPGVDETPSIRRPLLPGLA